MDKLKKLHRIKMLELFSGEHDDHLVSDIKKIERDIRDGSSIDEYQIWHIFNGIDIALRVGPNLKLVVNNV